jgi:hypothetical protein
MFKIIGGEPMQQIQAVFARNLDHSWSFMMGDDRAHCVCF